MTMQTLPQDLYRPDQVADMDRLAIQEHGIAGLDLMHRAGRAAYRDLRREWPAVRRLVIFCGAGNNGGDGYVIGRAALADGLSVQLFQLGDRNCLRGDAATVAAEFEAAGGRHEVFEHLDGGADTVVVDAMFGTGLDRPLEGIWEQAVHAINAAGMPVLAVDIPSGLHGGRGEVMGEAVRADVTVTFIGLKLGLFTGQGPARRGRLCFHDLAVPDAVWQAHEPAARRYRHGDGSPPVPGRQALAHKGDSGHLLIIGGNRGMGGAALLAGRGALRAGAGLVSVATRPEHVPSLLAAQPELMSHGLDRVQDLDVLSERADVLLLGPGLGQDDWARGLLERAGASGKPLVLDADALNLVAAGGGVPGMVLLTPHPGEAARLLGSSTQEVQADRLAAAQQLSEQTQAVVVLKGAGSVITAPGETPWICDGGSPALATGGTGDVLAGVAAALLAAGMVPHSAMLTAVAAHAEAGERLAAAEGVRGLLASDLPDAIRALLQA